MAAKTHSRAENGRLSWFVCLFVCYGTPAEVWGLGPTWTIYGLGDTIYFGASPPANRTDLESLWGPCPTN